MGQRHQAFVIARVRPHSADSSTPPKYRCIAAFHHQWCYGRLPLNATYRFITQVKNNNNAEIIRGEIAAIQGKYGGRLLQNSGPELPRIPCPYTAFLLATNWAVDLEDPDLPYASGVSFDNATLHADMGSRDGDNNDGISIIDVTDPESPSYCFVFHGGRNPISAEKYVRHYYPKPTPPPKPESEETEKETADRRRSLAIEENVEATIAKLKDVKLIDVGMLAEAWPEEYEKQGADENAAEAGSDLDTLVLPSLASMTMTPAVAHAVEDGDTADIETMVWMPDKATEVKTALRELSPFPDGGMTLLAKVIEMQLESNKTHLDLSGFSLSSAQLETLISSMEGIEVVNLSHSSTSIDDVRVILIKFPQLKRLVLLDCPSISSENIRDLLDTELQLFNHLEALLHPFLLGILHDASDTRPYRNAFSYIGLHSHQLKSCSLPFSVLQTSLVAQAAFSSVRAYGQKWSERNTVIIPQLSLRAFDGEGWAFACNIFPHSTDSNGYAFIRFKSIPTAIGGENPVAGLALKEDVITEADPDAMPQVPNLTWEIHDLASFIIQVTLDGKPPPPEEAVNQLQEILNTLETTQNMRLMGDADVKIFITAAKMAVFLLY